MEKSQLNGPFCRCAATHKFDAAAAPASHKSGTKLSFSLACSYSLEYVGV